MSRGRTQSRLSLAERREEASALYLKGFTIVEVADRLKVSWDTAKSYKRWHDRKISKAAEKNPQLLSDVLRNTVEMLAELDQVRAAAWRQYHSAESKQIKLQALNTIRAAQVDKSKLFGLFGVKQDFYVLVTNVKMVQDQLLAFMTRELCDGDRAKLEHFLSSPEIQQYMGLGALPELPTGDDDIIDAELVG